MIRLSDYLMRELADTHRVRDIFMVSGGGNMHLIDALGKNGKIRYIPNHHEQASAIAAEAYGRIKDLGVCLVTTGPGGTNTITGVIGAWFDSIPTLYISGQVKTETLAEPGMRQMGDQEANLVEMVKGITKYAVMVDNPKDIKYHLEKAIFLAKSGRPGPVWIDIPLDIQSAKIEESELREFTEEERQSLSVKASGNDVKENVSKVVELIKNAKRPVLFAGNGIRLSGGAEKLQEVIQKLKVPVLSSFNGMDLVGEENRYFYGRPGTIGGRCANFVLQNSDLFISIGSRLNIRIISYNFAAFARAAHKVMVDIDVSELNKKTLVQFDTKIQADAHEFLNELSEQVGSGIEQKTEWLEYCDRMRDTYPTVTKEHTSMEGYASAYFFTSKLSELLDKDAVVTMGDGMACVVPYKVFKAKYGQRLILNSGCAAMGYGFPASIGACYAHDKKQTICITGDGSIMMNLQELQTVVHNNLPIKIFILDNEGYLSIRTTQDTYFKGLRVGSDVNSGVSCPDYLKVSEAFGIKAFEIKTNDEVETRVKEVLAHDGPAVCVVRLNPDEMMLPKLSSKVMPDGSMVSQPLENLFPFLPEEEVANNMIIPLYDGSK